jgi:hypothetical protein
MAIDAQHVQAAFGCDGSSCGPTGEVWATSSHVGTAKMPPHAVVLAATLKAPYELQLGALKLGSAAEGVDWVGYEANTTASLHPIAAGASSKVAALPPCGKWDFQVWALAPWDRAASGFAFVGEQAKWVPASAARFSQLEFSSVFGTSGVALQQGAVTAKGTFGEVVEVTWAWGTDMNAPLQRHTFACTVPSSGAVRMTMIYGARPSTDPKAFHGYCGGEYVYGPV